MTMAINSTDSKVQKMVSIFKRGNMLYLKYKVDGKVIRESTEIKDTLVNRKMLEKEVLPKLEAQIALGRLSPKKEVKTFKYYATLYLSFKEDMKSYRSISTIVLNKLIPAFKDMKIDEIKRLDIKQFAQKMLQTVKPKTVRNTLNVLNGVFLVAIDDEVIATSPVTNIKLPNNPKEDVQPFTSAEIELILSSIKERWFRNFVAIAFYTGMRTGETMALMHKDIDFENKIIKVRRGITAGKVQTPKTGHSIRDVPMFDIVVPYLKDQLSISKNLFIFTTNKNTHFHDARGISFRRWKKLLNELGLKYRRLYTTRHTFITASLQSGKLLIMDIAKIVGHSDSQMIMTNYARFIDGEQLKIDRRIDVFGSKSIPTLVHTS